MKISLSRYFTFFLLWAATVTAQATTLGRVPLETLYKEADVVALLQVIEGKLLQPLGDKCGARHKGHVVEIFKGDKAKILEFGYAEGLRVGKRYLVFLTHSPREYRLLGSTNSVSRQREAEFEKKCASKQTAKKIMQGGQGAMVIEQV